MEINPLNNNSDWINNIDNGPAPKTSNQPNVTYQTGHDYLSQLSGQNRPNLLPGGGGTRENMLKAMASFEDLLILLTRLGRETRLSERQNQIQALQEKVSMLEASADKKLEAADKMRTAAIVNLVMTVTASVVSLVGAGVQTGKMASGLSKINKNGLSLQDIKNAPSGDALKSGGANTDALKSGGISKEGLTSLRGGELNTLSTKTQITGQYFQGVAQLLQGVGSFTQSWMQADSQSMQAEAEKIQAMAEQIGVYMQQAQSQEADFKEFMQKVNDLIRDFIAAQQKLTEAVSH